MIIIGEKINATLSPVKAIIESQDTGGIVDLARSQAAAGATFIDVNVGTGVGSRHDEVEAMKWAVSTIQAVVDTPLCIDSADPMVLAAGTESVRGVGCMINSAKAETRNLEAIIPLAVETNSRLIALTMDESGIPKTVEDRLKSAGKIALACEKHGLPMERVYFDPLVLPVSTDGEAGKVTLETLAAIKKTFPGAKTVTGISNISFGLPMRQPLNAAFLHMCLHLGLDAAILDPLDNTLMNAVAAGNLLIGKDRHCRRYLRIFRNHKEKDS